MSDEFDADFNAGFTGEEVVTTKPTDAPAEEVNQESPGAESVVEQTGVPAPEPAAVAAPKPKYAKITEEQLSQILAQSDENKRKFDQAFGKLGGMQQMIEQLRSSTAAGAPVEISAEDFAELKLEYPELTELTVKGMNKALSKMRGTGAPDPVQLEQLVQQRLEAETPRITEEIEKKVELKLLARSHSDWKDVVNSQDFKTWLEKQPENVRKAAAESWDSNVTIPIIGSFKESRKAAAAKTTQAVNSRQQRLQASVNPRGEGGVPSKPSDDDEFYAGFNSE